jgi:hypothetical protein
MAAMGTLLGILAAFMGGTDSRRQGRGASQAVRDEQQVHRRSARRRGLSGAATRGGLPKSTSLVSRGEGWGLLPARGSDPDRQLLMISAPCSTHRARGPTPHCEGSGRPPKPEKQPSGPVPPGGGCGTRLASRFREVHGSGADTRAAMASQATSHAQEPGTRSGAPRPPPWHADATIVQHRTRTL